MQGLGGSPRRAETCFCFSRPLWLSGGRGWETSGLGEQRWGRGSGEKRHNPRSVLKEEPTDTQEHQWGCLWQRQGGREAGRGQAEAWCGTSKGNSDSGNTGLSSALCARHRLRLFPFTVTKAQGGRKVPSTHFSQSPTPGATLLQDPTTRSLPQSLSSAPKPPGPLPLLYLLSRLHSQFAPCVPGPSLNSRFHLRISPTIPRPCPHTAGPPGAASNSPCETPQAPSQGPLT